jgi:hypothetical protein
MLAVIVQQRKALEHGGTMLEINHLDTIFRPFHLPFRRLPSHRRRPRARNGTILATSRLDTTLKPSQNRPTAGRFGTLQEEEVCPAKRDPARLQAADVLKLLSFRLRQLELKFNFNKL